MIVAAVGIACCIPLPPASATAPMGSHRHEICHEPYEQYEALCQYVHVVHSVRTTPSGRMHSVHLLRHGWSLWSGGRVVYSEYETERRVSLVRAGESHVEIRHVVAGHEGGYAEFGELDCVYRSAWHLVDGDVQFNRSSFDCEPAPIAG